MSRDEKKFSIDVFIKETDICIDTLGRNAISSFLITDYLYVISSPGDASWKMCFTILDISEVESHQIQEFATQEYNQYFFKDPYSGENIPFPFNIRDIVTYSVTPMYGSTSPLEKVHQVIVS